MDTSVKLLEQLHWLGHASFRLDAPVTIYFDPWQLEGEQPTADIVLVTHEHSDHCSPEDVARVSGPNTVVVASPGAAEKLNGDVRPVHPGDQVAVGDVTVEVVPAYNIHRFRSPGQPFHPKEQEHVGYVVSAGGERLYFAGDTDHVPEMAEIACDVALLPVGGKYTMDAEEAAEAAQDIGPRVAVPMHFGSSVVGEPADAERFRSLYGGEVFILEEE